MSLIESLLDAIVRLDGDALVLHVGEKPYVVTSSTAMNAFRGPLTWGQVELSTRVLSLDAVGSMLEQLLTPEQRELLGEMGAVEHELPATPERPAFTVIAARGGDDVWLEVRPIRPRTVEAVASLETLQGDEPIASAAETTPEPTEAIAANGEPEEPIPAPTELEPAEPIEPAAQTPIPSEAPIQTEAVSEADASRQTVGPAQAEPGAVAWDPLGRAEPEAMDASAPEPPAVIAPASADHPAPSLELVPEIEQAHPDDHEVSELIAGAGWVETDATGLAVDPGGEPIVFEANALEAALDEPAPRLEATGPTPVAGADEQRPPAAEIETPPRPEPTVAPPGVQLETDRAAELEAVPFSAIGSSDDHRPAVVLPLARTLRDQPPAPAELPSSKPSLDRLLRIAAARGASGLYLVAQSRPVVRVDGEMQPVDGEELLSAGDVEAFTLGLTSEPNREAVRSGATSEWFSDLPELGRVRCFTFSDHRGPGVIVRMLPARAISVEQLGLSMDIRGLCEQPDGLVLVAGPRASGKSTLIAAFVELVNRSRADHVVTIERQITFVHESRRSFVSQREVRGEAEAIASAVRGALREDPDVLVIEELRSADVAAAAIEAAESGRLVLAGLRASAAAPAIERLVEQFPAERRGQILRSLAGTLRGVVAQVLLRKRGGGRIAARELLLNTPAAASVIADGKLFQLGAALESGRKFGNVALNDTLLSLVRDGIVDAGEAWRRSHDREGLLTLLKREGIDTSFVERLA